MSIKVNVRVVGIYFGSSSNPLTVEVPDNPTVSQIMEAASNAAANGQFPNISGMTYSPDNPAVGSGQDMDSVSVVFENDFDSPSGTHLQAGVYKLSESSGNPYSVLQYYIFNQDFVQLNNNNDFVPFSDQPTEPIQNGYTVIWRQVSIASGPIQGAKLIARTKRMAKRKASK